METVMIQGRTQNVFTEKYYEYLLVAQPDETVYQQVMEEKQFFFSTFNSLTAIKSKPHITVANFMAKEAMEETITRWMHRLAGNRQSFNVTLDQYGAFRPHTIYLRVKDHQPFQQLAKELRVIDQYIRSYGCPEMHLVTHPHMTIARSLDQTIYQQAVKVYAAKTFSAGFELKELVLLRRAHEFDACKQIGVFGLRA